MKKSGESEVLLVGQAPSKLTEGLGAFRGRSGRFLAGMLGTTLEGFLASVEAVNLLDRWPGKAGKGDRFPAKLAGKKARLLPVVGRTVVLAGLNVAKAFGHVGRRFLEVWRSGGATFALVPHPSGVNRWWNDPANKEAAAELLGRLVGCRGSRRKRSS